VTPRCKRLRATTSPRAQHNALAASHRAAPRVSAPISGDDSLLALVWRGVAHIRVSRCYKGVRLPERHARGIFGLNLGMLSASMHSAGAPAYHQKRRKAAGGVSLVISRRLSACKMVCASSSRIGMGGDGLITRE